MTTRMNAIFAGPASAFPVSGRGRAAALLCAAALVLATSVQAADAPKAPKVDLAAGEKMVTEVCAACHAADGNSTIAANPKLAGQGADYLVKQLKDFKPGEKGEAARKDPVMGGFASMLSDADVLNVSFFLAGKAAKPSAAKDKELADLGRSIYRGGIADKGVPACAACHGPTGAGLPAQYPRVAGQFADYSESQLVKFRAGTRTNNAPMMTIAARLSDREIKAVSDYMAGLR